MEIQTELFLNEHYSNFVLALSSGIEDTGAPKWPLLMCLLLAWLIVFLCLSKGVQTSGKVRHPNEKRCSLFYRKLFGMMITTFTKTLK
jgi:hypothetical protein